MPDRQIIVCGKDLLGKIDGNRGDLSRNDFLELCIDSIVEEYPVAQTPEKETFWASRRLREPEQPAHTEFVRQTKVDTAVLQKFQELEQGVANLLLTFLEFCVALGVEFGQKDAEEVERIEHILSELKQNT